MKKERCLPHIVEVLQENRRFCPLPVWSITVLYNKKIKRDKADESLTLCETTMRKYLNGLAEEGKIERDQYDRISFYGPKSFQNEVKNE